MPSAHVMSVSIIIHNSYCTISLYTDKKHCAVEVKYLCRVDLIEFNTHISTHENTQARCFVCGQHIHVWLVFDLPHIRKHPPPPHSTHPASQPAYNNNFHVVASPASIDPVECVARVHIFVDCEV